MDKDFIKLEKESKKNQTKIEDVADEKEEKKGKKGRPPKKESFSVDEIQEKLVAVFNAFSFALKIEKEYKASDFIEESRDIVRLSQKYPIIHTILVLLDPLFLVLSFSKKIMELMKIVRKQRTAKTDDNKTS